MEVRVIQSIGKNACLTRAAAEIFICGFAIITGDFCHHLIAFASSPKFGPILKDFNFEKLANDKNMQKLPSMQRVKLSRFSEFRSHWDINMHPPPQKKINKIKIHRPLVCTIITL